MPGRIGEFKEGQSLGENVGGHIVLSEAGARRLNELRDVFQAVLDFMGMGDARTEFDPSSASLSASHTRRDPVPVLLSGAGNPYSGAERHRDGGGWVAPADPQTFTGDIYEVNAVSGLAGKVVRIRPSPTVEGEWLFQYHRVGEGEPCNGRICFTVRGVACEGEGEDPLLDGVLINVFTDPGEEFAGSCTTGLGDEGPGRCCVEVPPGTYLFRIPSPGPEGVGCEIEVTGIVVVCDEVEVEDQQTCCGQINITVIDHDTDGVIEGASIALAGGVVSTGPGTWKQQWSEHCDGFLQDALITADGYHDGCLHVEYKCHEQPSYTVKLYSEANWVRGGCCGDCYENGDRRPDMFPKEGLFLTFQGPPPIFGAWGGASIPVNFVGTAGDDWHVFESECLEGGGDWRCYRSPAVNCCEAGGVADSQGFRPVTPEEAEGSGDDEVRQYGSAKARLFIAAPGNTDDDCAFAEFQNWYGTDCGVTEPEALCVPSGGVPLTTPLYCLFTHPDFGEECGPGHGTNDCSYLTQEFPRFIGGYAGTGTAVGYPHTPVGEEICAIPDAEWPLGSVEEYDCPGDEEYSRSTVTLTEML